MGVVSLEPQAFEDLEDLYCGSVYPNPEVFKDCETALCLFTAEWLGKQDVYWLAKAGLTGACVDVQGEKLEQMAELYPEGWDFFEVDAYAFAESALDDGRRWDVVNLDPWTGQFDQCAKLIDTWTTLARKVVVLGHGYYRLAPPEAPEGWTLVDKIKRGDFKGGVYWLVFKRD